MIYTTVFNPSIDVVYNIAELKPGTTLLDTQSSIYPSGKGINVANVVRTLGEEVTVIGQVPTGSAKQFKDYLDDNEIKSVFFNTNGYARVNTTILESASGQITHLNSQSAAFPASKQDDIMKFVRKNIAKGDLWAFSGSAPKGLDKDVYQKLIASCKQAGAETLLDTRAEMLKRGVRAKPRMIKPNLAELEQFFGEQIQGVRHIALKSKRFVDMGIDYVFVSLGSDGLIAIHENDCLLCSPPQVKSVDTVGCGDALVAGLLVGFSRKFSFSEMCRMAVACGSSKAMHRGPGTVTRDEVWQLMEEVDVKSI